MSINSVIYTKALNCLTSNLIDDDMTQLFIAMDGDPYDGFFELICDHVRRVRPDFFEHSREETKWFDPTKQRSEYGD